MAAAPIERLRWIARDLPLAVVVEDRDGRVCEWNDAAAQMLGWTTVDTLGRVFPHVPENAREGALSDHRRVLQGDVLRDRAFVCLRGDGSLIEVGRHAGPLHGEDGAVEGVVSVLVDRGQRRRLERELSLHVEITRSLVESPTLDEALARVLAALCGAFGLECGAFWVTADEGAALRCLATWCVPDDVAAAQAIAGKLGVTVSAHADPSPVARALRGEPGGACDQRAGDGVSGTCDSQGMRARMLVPLRSGDAVHGVIELIGRGSSPVDDPLAASLGHFAGQLGQFIARREAERTLEFVASHDPLTGLPNRAMFGQRLAQAVAQAARYGRRAAVLFVDLDRFKIINDTLGHDVGDRLLEDVAERLRECLRAGDTVGRHGGDEFVVLIDQYDASGQVAGVAQKIIDRVGAPFLIDGQELHVSASIGIATYPADGADAQSLLRQADVAMYRAKEAGKNQYQFYSPRMNRHSMDRLAMETALRHALDRGELEVHYQPKFSVKDGKVVAMEALVRWARPGHGLVPPGDFLPLAEETGIAVPIGEWVLKRACTDALAWPGADGVPVRVAVNVSARHFAHGRLQDCVERTLRETGLPASLLELEITEAMTAANADRGARVLRSLEHLGVRLVVDDFGTGASSLSFLHRFPFYAVKIDRSFVGEIPDNPDGAAITRAVIAMAKSLKLVVIAEGVETDAQARFLRIHGCDELQGHHFSAPLPAAAARALLDRLHSQAVSRKA